jgi:hypothetical protein
MALSAPIDKVEVSTPAAPDEPNVAREFSQVVHRELGQMKLPGDARGYILSAALTQFETRSEQRTVEAQAAVSLTLRDKQGGTIRAILSGRAKTIDSREERRRAQQVAMGAALRSALKRLPEAIQ